MEQLFGISWQQYHYFLLFFFRISGLILSSPIFGRRNIPNGAKIGLCLFLSYITFLAVPPPDVPLAYHNFYEFALLLVKEALFGVIMGFVTTMFFAVAYSAGQLMDMQIGFGIVNVYDANANIQIPLIGNILNLIMLLVFFSVGGHLNLIYILGTTFEAVPVGQVHIDPGIGMAALEVFALSFVLAIKVAMPVLAAGLIMEIAMGVILRSVPQMNMFVVGIPLKLGIGFIVLMAVIPLFVYFCEPLFENMYQSMDLMFKALVTGG